MCVHVCVFTFVFIFMHPLRRNVETVVKMRQKKYLERKETADGSYVCFILWCKNETLCEDMRGCSPERCLSGISPMDEKCFCFELT